MLNLFYIPGKQRNVIITVLRCRTLTRLGAFIGAYVSDWIGPRRALAFGVLAQACVGFLLAGIYPILAKPSNIAGFVVC